MTITMVMTVYALLVALALWGAGGLAARPVLFSRLGNLAWLGLVACFGLLSYDKLPGMAALLATASLGSSCMLTTVERERWGGVRLGSVVAVMWGVCGVVLAANTFYDPVVVDRNLVLSAGQWAGLSAAGTAALMAISYDRDDLGTGLCAATCIAGALWMGVMRSDLPGFAYVVELSSDNQPVVWVLPGVTPGSSLFAFSVTQVIDGVMVVLGLGAASALLGGALARVNRKVAAGSALLGGALSLVALGMVLWSGFHATLPDVGPYAAHAMELGKEKGIPEQILAMGTFSFGETIYVLWLDVLGDLGLMGGAAWLLGHMGIRQLRSTQERSYDPKMMGLFAQRAAGLLWLGWILGLFVNWRLHAIYGVGSATEWSLLGAAVVASGGAVLCMLPSERMQRVGALVVMLAVTLTLVLSLVFEVPPGVVMN